IDGQHSALSVSPDGTRVVVSNMQQGSSNRLWVRRLDSVESQPLNGSEGAEGVPFWSPDSRFIAFTSQGKLKKIEAAGGPAETLADATGIYGGFWTADGRIVFSSEKALSFHDLREVSAAGGIATPFQNALHVFAPALLPDGRHFIYLYETGNSSTGIFLGSLDAKPAQSARKLLPDDSDVVYAPSQDPNLGYLLFVRGRSGAGTLMAQIFDLRKFELVGEPVPIAQRVSAFASFSVSQTGVLAYRSADAAPSQLTWFDRQGKVLGTLGEPGDHRDIAISPDGMRAAVSRATQTGEDIWLYELARGINARFTFQGGRYPVWSPDGSRIVFESPRDGRADLYEKLSNGGGADELLFKSEENNVPLGWSPDGRFLFFASDGVPLRSWVLPLDSQGHAAGKPYLVLNGGIAERFSQDMRWVVYDSDESGRFEV
ncbi:MAG: hypothetical protein ABSE57_30605, partial [Bryobacteraceae bacterium]